MSTKHKLKYPASRVLKTFSYHFKDSQNLEEYMLQPGLKLHKSKLTQYTVTDAKLQNTQTQKTVKVPFKESPVTVLVTVLVQLAW